MLNFIISAIKIIFLLGFLIFIHEGGHFLIAKLCKVKVNEFAIGFGPTIFKKKYQETQYAVRLIPLGGFVSMEGEMEDSAAENAFNNASISRRIAIVAAGAVVNIVFGIIVFMIIFSIKYGSILDGLQVTGAFLQSILESLRLIFTGNISIKDLTGPVGISSVVSQTSGIAQYFYIMSVVSVSLGVTNLLPIPALDGGKILLLIIELIRRKPLKQELEVKIQLLGFSFLIALSIFVTYNDVLRAIGK